MRTVLIVAGLGERYYYESFITAARERDVRVLVFDPTAFPEALKLSLHLDNEAGLSGEIDAYDVQDESPTIASLSLHEIDVAWYLREGPVEMPKVELSTSERFRRNESRAAIETLFSVLPARWVNRRDAITRLQSNKLFQQLIARRCGLAVPSTVLGNDPHRVIDLSEECGGLLLKSLGYIRLDDAGRYHLYSERFTHKELSESTTAVRECPVFSQEYIQKRYEYRVMVIGEQVLTCRIDSQSSASEKTRTDWRHYDLQNVEHQAVDLPEEVAEKLRAFMRTVGLGYGAIDLIETPDGEFVFLEVNPSGQWGWVHELAGLPIPEAVAEMLEKF